MMEAPGSDAEGFAYISERAMRVISRHYFRAEVKNFEE